MKGYAYQKTKRRGAPWYVRYDGPRKADGSRNQLSLGKGFPTRRVAEEALADVLSRMASGTWVEPSTLTLADYLNKRWLPHKRQLRGRTLERYGSLIHQHVIPSIGHIKLSKLRPLDIQHLIDNAKRRDGKGGELSARSLLQMYRVLKASLRQAVRWQLLAVNPADAITPPKIERPNLMRVGPEVAGEVLRASRGTNLELLVALGLGAGLRRGEVYGLRWADLDLDHGIACIRQTLQVGGEFTEPKTERSRRDVSLPAFVVETLRRHRAEQARRRLLMGEAWHDHDLVCERGDGRPCDTRKASHTFKRLARRLGYPQLRLHDTRHGFATLSLAAGTDLKVISNQMGHASYAITADVYADVIPALQTDAAARLDALLGATVATI